MDDVQRLVSSVKRDMRLQHVVRSATAKVAKADNMTARVQPLELQLEALARKIAQLEAEIARTTDLPKVLAKRHKLGVAITKHVLLAANLAARVDASKPLPSANHDRELWSGTGKGFDIYVPRAHKRTEQERQEALRLAKLAHKQVKYVIMCDYGDGKAMPLRNTDQSITHFDKRDDAVIFAAHIGPHCYVTEV
jgi:hypothetical protein